MKYKTMTPQDLERLKCELSKYYVGMYDCKTEDNFSYDILRAFDHGFDAAVKILSEEIAELRGDFNRLIKERMLLRLELADMNEALAKICSDFNTDHCGEKSMIAHEVLEKWRDVK